jgi:hypothetical protein
MIEEDLRADIVALNTSAGSRVHIGNAPQGTLYPVVILRRTGGNTPTTLGGAPLFTRTSFSIHILHKGKVESGVGGYSDAVPVASAIRDRFHGFHGAMGDTDVASARITSDVVDASEIDGDKVTRWLQQDVLIVHR